MKKIDRKELYNLDHTIIEWLVPRLKVFKERTTGYPGDVTEEEWDNILDKIIAGLTAYKAERPWDENLSKQENLDQDKVFYEQQNSYFKEAMGVIN